jgi:hypothetical protein
MFKNDVPIYVEGENPLKNLLKVESVQGGNPFKIELCSSTLKA